MKVEASDMDMCIYCSEQVYPDDEQVKTCSGVAHFECSENDDSEAMDSYS